MFVGCCFFASSLYAQNKVDSLTEKKENSLTPVYIEGQWDNDLLQFGGKSDRYYSNGVKLQITSGFLGKLPTKYALLKLKNTSSKEYYVRFGQEIFTPTDISKDYFVPNDHVYAGWLYGSFGALSFNEEKGRKLTSELQIGVMGDLSFAEETQTVIHEWTGSETPKGWDYQLPNTVAANYYLKYEQRLNHPAQDWLEVIPNVGAGVGMVQNYAEAGATFRLGLLDNYFSKSGLFAQKSKKKFSMYLSAAPSAGYMFYNAMLEGPIFGDRGPYAMQSDDITHEYFKIRYGLTLRYDRFELGFYENRRSKAFTNGDSHRWGEIKVGIRLF